MANTNLDKRLQVSEGTIIKIIIIIIIILRFEH